MNSIVKTAKTVNEAIEAALKELNATRDMVDVEVQEESKSGFLGFLGSRNAVVKVTLKEVVEENKDFNAPCDFKSEYVEKDEPEALEFAKKYLLDMLKQLDITANIEIKKDFENEKVDLKCSNTDSCNFTYIFDCFHKIISCLTSPRPPWIPSWWAKCWKS